MSKPVIVLTNAFDPAMLEMARSAGADHCLSKSKATPNELVQVIRNRIAIQSSYDNSYTPIKEEGGSSALPPEDVEIEAAGTLARSTLELTRLAGILLCGSWTRCEIFGIGPPRFHQFKF
jgi:DNA-binding NarL/FixJ family response regulator